MRGAGTGRGEDAANGPPEPDPLPTDDVETSNDRSKDDIRDETLTWSAQRLLSSAITSANVGDGEGDGMAGGGPLGAERKESGSGAV